MMYPQPPEPKPDSPPEPSGSAQLAAERILSRLDCLSDEIARIIDEVMDEVVATNLADAAPNAEAGEPLMTAGQAGLEADIDAQNADDDRHGRNEVGESGP